MTNSTDMATRWQPSPAVPRQAEQAGPQDFEDFFATWHRPLYRALWLVTRNRHEAEEVMQDAFLKVWERWDRVAAMDSPEGYLFQTAMNLYRSRLRRMVAAVRRTIRVLPSDDELRTVEERDAIVRAMGSLTPAQRSAVVLVDLVGMSSVEAGRALGVRPVTVRVLVSRGRAALKERMGTSDV
jgi:RNA polymerase sigma-70 factor (ECF subfamily)